MPSSYSVNKDQDLEIGSDFLERNSTKGAGCPSCTLFLTLRSALKFVNMILYPKPSPFNMKQTPPLCLRGDCKKFVVFYLIENRGCGQLRWSVKVSSNSSDVFF